MVFIGGEKFAHATIYSIVHFTVHVGNPTEIFYASEHCSCHCAHQESCRHTVHIYTLFTLLFMLLWINFCL